MGKYMVGKNPPINGPNYDGYKSRWGYFLMGKPRWVRLHDGYKSMMSIPRWAFVIEKICDGQIAQIADGERLWIYWVFFPRIWKNISRV